MGSSVSTVTANLYMESFEEQPITTSSYEPRIWKRYVDDTFTILDRENVDAFLQHLNNQQPSIRFTMETEKDNKLAFLDTVVLIILLSTLKLTPELTSLSSPRAFAKS